MTAFGAAVAGLAELADLSEVALDVAGDRERAAPLLRADVEDADAGNAHGEVGLAPTLSHPRSRRHGGKQKPT